MSDRIRTVLLVIFGLPLAGLLVWGVTGLPGFGRYPGPYGDIVLKTTVPERHVTDVVTSVMFDQRGLDTLGEEFILFAAVAGVILLLREHDNIEAEPEPEDRKNVPFVKSDAVTLLGMVGAPLILLFGVYVVAQAHITVGGGFQGGIVIASAWLLLYLADAREIFHKFSPKHRVEICEALGAGAYAAIGLGGLIAGAAFLENVLSLGKAGELLSGGTIPLINLGVGVEVSAAFLLLMVEFLRESQKAEDVNK